MQKKTLLNTSRLSPAAFRAQKKRPVALVLDNIRSGYNVGSAFRLGDAFLLAHLYLCGITPKPPHPQIHKTALGSENTLSWSHVANTANLLMHLKKQGYQLIAVEQTVPSTPLQALKTITTTPPYALIFGHEVFGISQEGLAVVDACVEIPQYGTKFSMNVAVCMGIVVWELLRNIPPPISG